MMDLLWVAASSPSKGLIIAFLVVLVLLLVITMISTAISRRVKGIQQKQEIVAVAAATAAEAASAIVARRTMLSDEKIERIEHMVNGQHEWLVARVRQLDAQLRRHGIVPDPPASPEL
jgi:ABC-type transport system involved in multi-copper enzyme maturation permease subunit